MKTWKATVLAGALALSAGPIVAMPQPASSTTTTKTSTKNSRPRRRHRRHRRHHRNH